MLGPTFCGVRISGPIFYLGTHYTIDNLPDRLTILGSTLGSGEEFWDRLTILGPSLSFGQESEFWDRLCTHFKPRGGSGGDSPPPPVAPLLDKSVALIASKQADESPCLWVVGHAGLALLM